jgi:predicted RNA methylase
MSSYNDIAGHHSMLFDAVRNDAYLNAIKACVTKESVVLDLGAGLSLHGLMAAKAGAKKVYLVDPSPAVLAAKTIAKQNGLDNVEVIQSAIQDIELPEKVDIIISVFTGNFLLSEDLLQWLFVARDKFLKPDGIMLPDKARMIAAPVSMPKYYTSQIEMWADEHPDSLYERYGLSYESAQKYSSNRVFYANFSSESFQLLATPAILIQIDFCSAASADCDSTQDYVTTLAGDCHGWLGWFDMALGDKWLSTSPESKSTHWSQAFLPLNKPVELDKGEHIKLTLKRPQNGDWSWATKAHTNQQQSTFLAKTITPELLKKQLPTYSPDRTAQADQLYYALSLFDGKNTVTEIGIKLKAKYPEMFEQEGSAQNFVQILAVKYSGL